MIFEAIKTCDDSILISNGKIIKRWDFNGDEIESVNKEVFDSLKQILTFEKIEYNSFDEAKEAFQKYWKMLIYIDAPYYQLNRV